MKALTSTILIAMVLCIAGVPASEAEDQADGRLGVRVRMGNGSLVIVDLFANQAGEKAGLRINDLIIKIDGVSLAGFTLEQALEKLRGPVGTAATIVVSRGNPAQLLTFTIVREPMGEQEVRIEKISKLISQQKYAEALPLIQKGVEMGYAGDQGTLGWMYASGRGVSTNYQEARKWYRKAADQGNLAAIHYLGLMSLEGRGGEPDYKEAMKWFRKAIEQNFPLSQESVCYMYEQGLGVQKDYQQAVYYCTLAANQNDAAAQRRLGAYLLNGWGVKQDYVQGRLWSEKAAAANDMYAMANLGAIFENGWGVAVDFGESARWYRQAAELGHAESKEKLLTLPSVRIIASESQPARLKPGGKFRLTLLWEISGLPIDQSVPVEIERQLYLDGTPLFSAPQVEKINKGTGRHTTEFEFPIPPSAKPGTYVFETTVQGLGTTIKKENVFVIIP